MLLSYKKHTSRNKSNYLFILYINIYPEIQNKQSKCTLQDLSNTYISHFPQTTDFQIKKTYVHTIGKMNNVKL